MSVSLQVDTSYKQVIKIAAPIALALFVPQINLITNSIFLGHHSEESLAAAAITGVYYLVFAGVGFGLNNGLQTLISRRAGENRPVEIGKIFTQAIIIASIVAAVGILVTEIVTPPVLKAFLSAEQANKAIGFLRIRIWGLPFLYVYQLRNALLVGINQSKYLIIGTLAEAIANIFFDYSLIFGKMGFPAMGFNGAAVASIIAEFTGMVVIFWVISKKGIAQKFSLFNRLRFERNTARLIAKISGPLAFQHATSILAWFFFYMLVARNASQTGLAISTAMRTVFGFFGTCFWSLAATTNSMVSNVIGQGRRDEVLRLMWRISRLSLGLAIIVCLLLNLFPGLYLSLFRPNDIAFVNEGIPVLRLIGFVTLFLSIGTIWLNAVTGTGNSRVTFLVEVSTLVFYCVYVFVVLEVKHMPIIWGWLSEVLYWTLLFSLSYLYMKSQRWKQTVI